MATVHVRYEQAVYGSFPFWDRGYALLAQSPGCRPRWLAELRAACQRHGERPAGAAEAGGLFALRPAGGPWLIVGVSPQGRDDRGRPGALAFHALFVTPRDYARAGASPFGFAHLLRGDWTAGTRSLPSGTAVIELPRPPDDLPDEQVARLARALSRGLQVTLEADGPIDALARQVWAALPSGTRRRASVATWAFGDGNRFDLVARPRPAGGDEAGVVAQQVDGRPARNHNRTLLALATVAFLALVAASLVRHRDGGVAVAPASLPAEASPPSRAPGSRADRSPPDPSRYRDDLDDLDERRRVTEGLVDMAERFGVLTPEAAARGPVPADVMILLARGLRYRGPLLSADERAGLERGRDGASGHDRDLALRWDALVRRFTDDRALPKGFARGPLRWQLDTLAWSFHLDDDPDAPRRSPAEVPHALAEALAVDVPLRATPLAARHPALVAYLEFLGRLPRR